MNLTTHISYRHASILGCNFKEAMFVLMIGEIANFFVSLVFKLILGFMFFPYFIGVFVAFGVSINMMRILGNLKKGKQEGYLSLKYYQFMSQFLGIHSPYITRRGYWSKRYAITNNLERG